jgi:hypothetical protein
LHPTADTRDFKFLQSLGTAGDAEHYASPSLRVTNMQTSNKTSIWLFLFSFALVFYGMGASFVESFVNYPTWRLIGANEFRAYHQALSPLVIGYMVIPKILATILTILLLWFKPAPLPRWAIWLAVVLQLIPWVSTVAIQFPIQVQLSSDGLSLPLIERLIFTNWWLRKVPQIINALLFLWLMSLLLRVNSKRSAEA